MSMLTGLHALPGRAELVAKAPDDDDETGKTHELAPPPSCEPTIHDNKPITNVSFFVPPHV